MSDKARWRAYLDSNFFIRFVESEDERLAPLFAHLEAGLLTLHTSELTLAELLVGPLRTANADLSERYEDIIGASDWLQASPVSREILKRSAEIRATIGNKQPDANHVATAMAEACNVFVSSDKRLKMPETMKRIGLDEVAIEEVWP
ncbi:type II toxin-antitoxin system VapC family toxin [Afifella marina]|uniref:Predicted nucleic acid-binding protein, contains PIN domain n=1 Tax=Afifella marina DSM 2698 TaxID=1120955 RepID=A0A1G5NAI5_AFIMA|nr:type II toxin-antitoxin system VapC family toxin [Afifella marina]SCZ34417.1 Predicted nucleic acid-binding protein, contains PIN domain [Afifella marina DSM 2698]